MSPATRLRPLVCLSVALLCLAACSAPRLAREALAGRVPAPAALAEGLPDTVRFVVMGDNRLAGSEDHPRDSPRRESRRALNRAAAARDPHFLLHAGDIVRRGDEPRLWDLFLEDTAPLLQPRFFYPVPGNHAYKGGFPARWYKVFAGSTARAKSWAFEAGSLFVIGFDSIADPSATDFDDPENPHAAWLRERLREARESRTLVLLLHHPVFSTGRGRIGRFLPGLGGVGHAPREREIRLRSVLSEVHRERKRRDPFARTIVFSGHSHFYERYRHEGVDYIVTGGAGSPLHRPADPPQPARLAAYHGFHFVEVALTGTGVRLDVHTVGPGRWIQSDPSYAR